MSSLRPDPDELLLAVQHSEKGRGRLKVFLGASAGVGKTYAMLSEAHERLKRGQDVVIGYVEAHQRAETHAMMEGLEAVPLRTVFHRGAELFEVNIPAILERKPELVLIDELAHSNPPGSTHAKRWQDINDVLDAGINVFTAVNIQHLESLRDVVAQVTGIQVNETVPDSFFEQANEIELIDLPPAELQQRLKDGKVYVPERIEHALAGFFKATNLTALRELALRKTADSVDAEMQRLRIQEGSRSTWATRERILVCIAPNTMGQRIVRAAARMAATTHAEMIAVYVESDRQSSRHAEVHEHARQAMDLAKELGFEVIQLQSHDIVQEVLSLAQRKNASLIVVGKPIKPRWKEILYGSVVDELVRRSGDIDVHVITGDAEGKASEKPRTIDHPTAIGLTIGVLSLGVTTALGLATFEWLGLTNLAMLYILAVTLSSVRCNRMESAILSVVGVLSFNFCFVEPRYTFAVSDIRFVLVFIVMLAVGLVISSLTHQLRDQVSRSSERERRTASLYSLSKRLAQGR
ncbi:MAG TPA: DUF4118 domain-containing protein, partial [Fimbriimonas sp.]|nr:DUF4118 domain-containing protein [Fimbriimonas sp.]